MTRSVCLTVLAILSSACGAVPGRPPEPPAGPGVLWVVAPHPDDEALFGAAPLWTAVAEGRPVRVIVVTNGDLGCGRDGYLRERETVAAMAVLGVPEDRVAFLGYPDGLLSRLGDLPLPPLERRDDRGAGGEGATTYAARGEGGLDVHARLTGSAGAYVAENAVADLAALLERDRPSDVFTAHPIDDHPDHAATYVLLRRALERARPEGLPRIHRALVHAGACWPNGSDPSEPCPAIDPSAPRSPYPPLPGPLGGYVPDERLAVPDLGARARRAIAEYRSQLHVDVEEDWLGSFARADAVYWTEVLAPDPAHPDRLEPGPVGAPVPLPLEIEAQGSVTVARGPSHAPARFLLRGDTGPSGSLRLRVFGSGPGEGYEIVLSADRLELRGHGIGRVVPLPATAETEHALEVRASLDPAGALRLEARRDGVLLGGMVDPEPWIAGESVEATASEGAAVGSVEGWSEAPGAHAARAL